MAEFVQNVEGKMGKIFYMSIYLMQEDIIFSEI